MQHQVWILYKANVTQLDSEMYYLHESSCHFQFMRQLWHSERRSGHCGRAGSLNAPLERPALFLHNVLKPASQTECTCVHPLARFSGENCVITKCSCTKPHPSLSFLILSIPQHFLATARNSQFFFSWPAGSAGWVPAHHKQAPPCLSGSGKLNWLWTFSNSF